MNGNVHTLDVPPGLLILMRHAKSSWAQPGMPDFDRPLAERGVRSAPVMGRWLAAQPRRPGLILTSPARRTRETADLVLNELSQVTQADIVRDERIYEADVPALLQVIGEQRVPTLMLVGHNPGLEELLGYLAGNFTEATAGQRKSFPTGAIYVLESKVPWDAAGRGMMRIIAHMRPRLLDGDDD